MGLGGQSTVLGQHRGRRQNKWKGVYPLGGGSDFSARGVERIFQEMQGDFQAGDFSRGSLILCLFDRLNSHRFKLPCLNPSFTRKCPPSENRPQPERGRLLSGALFLFWRPSERKWFP